jgi:hydroxyethylthiazole kinase-like uncharacterized protein yjeF
MYRYSPVLPHSLFDSTATRHLEQLAAAALPRHALMQRAGLAVARLALALAPHARTVWIACGPGNNGGDGLEAAVHLKQWGKAPQVTWLGDEARLPADALAALQRARAAGVPFCDAAPPELTRSDLAIDALLGIGSQRALQGRLAELAAQLNASAAPVLAVDLPSGLNADTGCLPRLDSGQASVTVQAQHTLSLLSLKPGLFTAQGRDACGQLWFDDLAVDANSQPCSATLLGAPAQRARLHASHKGSFGDVAIVGGAPGMTGAALLAARAALHSGAGRVYVVLLDPQGMAVDALQPELMWRKLDALDFKTTTLVCGCGAGGAVQAVLPHILSTPSALVLDADALNTLARETPLQQLLLARAQRGRVTVLTPHPLEAARLLGCDVAQLQADRLRSARQMADRFGCVVVLKGSGSVIARPGQNPALNPTGNARLATAGTGDVLAGMVGAGLASGMDAFDAACAAVYRHGAIADQWPAGDVLTAGLMPARMGAA